MRTTNTEFRDMCDDAESAGRITLDGLRAEVMGHANAFPSIVAIVSSDPMVYRSVEFSRAAIERIIRADARNGKGCEFRSQ